MAERRSAQESHVVNQVLAVATGWGYAARCGCGWKTSHDTRSAALAAGQRHLRDDLAARIWEWLPARTDGRRVTLPHIAAAALGLPVAEVSASVAAMERAGHVVRNRAVGRQSGWHRGTPLPGLATETASGPDERLPKPTLFDDEDDEVS